MADAGAAGLDAAVIAVDALPAVEGGDGLAVEEEAHLLGQRRPFGQALGPVAVPPSLLERQQIVGAPGADGAVAYVVEIPIGELRMI